MPRFVREKQRGVREEAEGALAAPIDSDRPGVAATSASGRCSGTGAPRGSRGTKAPRRIPRAAAGRRP
ncbi:hypothetical protein MRX96_023149 [Rhipicephalus microplus]